MAEFGWTIEYTLSLTLPIFFYLLTKLPNIRTNKAYHQFFSAYAAAKYGKESLDHFMKNRGSVLLDMEVEFYQPTDDDFARAQQKAIATAQKITGKDQIHVLNYDKRECIVKEQRTRRRKV